MRVALYARVSTSRQAQAQTIDQQVSRLQAHVSQQDWTVNPEHVFRDDGFSGARFNRPGLDQLRDRVARAEVDRVLVTEPDRLARKYVHQVLLIEEWQGHGCEVEFIDRPMSQDPHDQLLLQIRGAVAEYERTLISERMRRGRLVRLQAGQLLPWTRPPFGFRVDPEHPRAAAGLTCDAYEAAIVDSMFARYLEPGATLYSLAKRLSDEGVTTPMGKRIWNPATVRGILRNPAYAGTAYAGRTRSEPARQRKSALLPIGPGQSSRPTSPENWIAIPVPAIISQEVFDLVQEKLDSNQPITARNNTRTKYLLRGLVSCGVCHLSAFGRSATEGYAYYVCRGKTDSLRASNNDRCQARYFPARQLDELVWSDLCAVLTEPEIMNHALERAKGGSWLPQELQSRQTTLKRSIKQLDQQQTRLMDAYLASVIELTELQRRRAELAQHQATLAAQQRQLDAVAKQHLDVAALADGIERFCSQVRAGLLDATFEERRALVELLIDRVIMTNGEVEIRYVIPTSPDGPHRRFCHLRLDYLDDPAAVVGLDDLGHRSPANRQIGQEHTPPEAVPGDLDRGLVIDHTADQVASAVRLTTSRVRLVSPHNVQQPRYPTIGTSTGAAPTPTIGTCSTAFSGSCALAVRGEGCLPTTLHDTSVAGTIGSGAR